MFYYLMFFLVPLGIIWIVGGRAGAKFSFVGLMIVISVIAFIVGSVSGVLLAEGFSLMPGHGWADYFHQIAVSDIPDQFTVQRMWDEHSMGYAAFTWVYYALYDLMSMIWMFDTKHPNGWLYFAQFVSIVWIVNIPFRAVLMVIISMREMREMEAVS